MAARPPPSDSSEPDLIEFGIAALDARLENTELTYPTTATKIVDAVQQTAIPIDGSGNTVELQEALEQLPQQEFENKTELLNQLHPVFEMYREEASSGFFGRLRSLLPF
ncbi:hypothetical protein [Natronocalculus amylovorans]|uniref:Uncharacterized protein n=1 Tax=Natronocalculus amylovorans TaxID=2917812 RepID=A0AAE3K8N7_9EURY|nr:hypothetical protein [Natronocalculus amylovorans]MCL9817228.1 hypothetical protein [Natronocalculus amylovorans]NUE02743.1 hypothetical protein [Halorubraceae archaeon YAN]